MKKLLIGMLFLGLTNLAFAQTSSNEGSILELEGVTIMPANMGYLSIVSSAVKSTKVASLQRAAASHDITKTSIYNRKERFYEFTFKQQDGYLLATYDRHGKILKSYERYKNIPFPVPVRQSLYKAFPGWFTETNQYIVSFASGQGAKKIIKLKMVKDGKTKRVTVDTRGNIL